MTGTTISTHREISMDTNEALRELRRVTYKPNHRFWFSTTGDGLIAVRFEAWHDNSTPRDRDPRDRVLTDGEFELDVSDIHDSTELHRTFCTAIWDEIEGHETREFYRVDGHAPFHPHRIDGRARWDGRVRYDAVVGR